MISLIIMFLLFLGLLMGLRRGFVIQLIHLVGFFLSFIFATIFYKRLAGSLSMWIPYPELSTDNTWAMFLATMPLENAFYNAVSFAIIFFSVKVILQIIGYMIDIVVNIPLLRSMNKLLGAILGFIEMYAITFIVLFIFALVPLDSVQHKLSSSFMAKLMIQHTPIVSRITESLLFTDTLSQLF